LGSGRAIREKEGKSLKIRFFCHFLDSEDTVLEMAGQDRGVEQGLFDIPFWVSSISLNSENGRC
jgi:hypothetical protein